MLRTHLARTCLFLLAAMTLVPSCGSGTLANFWKQFPASAFEDETEGGDEGDDGRPNIPGTFEPTEVAFLDIAQGVDGDVRNIEVAVVGAQALAFLSADTEGLHVIDVTTPEVLTTSELLGTVPGSNFAGGRVDMLAVIDGVHLVCAAVGANTSANSVTVLHIPTLQAILNASGTDFSAAILSRAGASILIDGDETGRAGGISGGAGFFFVATGGDTLESASIDATAGTWTANPGFTPASPIIDKFIDVIATGTNAFASVFSNGSHGIISITVNLAALPPLSVDTDPALQVAGNFSRYANNAVGAPGNWALDLAVEGPILFVGGDDQVETFNITAPALPIPAQPLTESGVNTVNIAAAGGAIAVTSGTELVVFQSAGGISTSVSYEFSEINLNARGVALRSTATGRYALVAGGGRGLRVIQWSNIPG
ncbi:MAG: hypothetical protein V3T86_02825 [Planctomycetota bacterium]